MIRTVKLLLLSFASMLLISTSAFAQGPTQMRLSVYAAGGTSPIQSSLAPISAVTCNQAVSATAKNINEARAAAWDDPVNVGKECSLSFSAFFGGLPIGDYQFTITEVDATGADWSQESAKTVPFRKVGPAKLNPRLVK